jgi:tryptophan synthase alpha chain
MSQLTNLFIQLKARKRTALAPYFMAGYPDLETSFFLMREAAQAGADLIEMGMPFSDPLADGPTIQKAGQSALEHPFALRELLQRFGKARESIGIPVVLMTYYNPVFQLGLKKTAEMAAANGVAGFIVPDLPLEESGEFGQACASESLDLVPLIAPTSSPERVQKIDSKATGMLYYVSRVGTTGARTELPPELLVALDAFRNSTTHPFVVGFGISTPEHAKRLRGHADGIVIASAIIDRLSATPPEDLARCVRDFLKPLSEVLG